MKIVNSIRQNLRPFAMIIAMCSGVLFHSPLTTLDELTNFQLAPSLIFGMLFVTFCKVRISDMKVSTMHITLLLFQITMAVGSYFAMLPMGVILAQGAMICFLAPIAMGAVAIGGILGANVASIASYSLFCNFAIAVVAPYILATFGNGECTFLQIMARVAPILIAPFVAAQILKVVWRSVADLIGRNSQISFYLWIISMIITLGRTTSFILGYNGSATLFEQFGLAIIAFVACVMQFSLGRIIGRNYGETITAGQSLGQKNTVLAVWLAQSFLTPISSIAPTAYIIWQNVINSLQIFLHDRKARKLIHKEQNLE
ncbi:MAG: transporter [Rikenellaceae bacterium]